MPEKENRPPGCTKSLKTTLESFFCFTSTWASTIDPVYSRVRSSTLPSQPQSSESLSESLSLQESESLSSSGHSGPPSRLRPATTKKSPNCIPGPIGCEQLVWILVLRLPLT